MSEAPSQPPVSVSTSETPPYWCYHCEKRVSTETLPSGMEEKFKCYNSSTSGNIRKRKTTLQSILELGQSIHFGFHDPQDPYRYGCKNGFVEFIPPPTALNNPSPSPSSDSDDPYFGSPFLHLIRLIAQSARDDDAPPPPPPSRSPDNDFLRIELGGWNNDEEDDDGEGEEDEDRIGDDEDLRRRRREVLRLRIRNLATRTRSMRNRILDWSDILTGLEDNSIQFRLQVPESDRYVGNPEDYVDAAEYEALLQTLAETDGGGKRGAPPAAKSAVEALPTVEIVSEKEVVACAICKDMVGVGDVAKRLPCGHEYHGDCIVPWLGSRNSCPVCRFELPTDDKEYEQQRKNKRVMNSSSNGASGSGGSG